MSEPAGDPPSVLERIATTLRALTARPGLLFVGLLALNALARPYQGIDHDAVLYAFQVTNRIEDGRHSADLYFRYGSQDQYTIFSPVVAPVARLLGVPAAFFLFYLIAKVMFVLGLQRLVVGLVADRALAVVALVYLVVTPIPFGGVSVFNVNESFLTPRLLAGALVLLALGCLLDRRPLISLALLVVALLFHPVMAFPGVLVWAGWRLTTYLSRKAIAGVLVGGAVGATLFLAIPAAATRFLGHMDADWNDAVRRAAFVNFPADWQFADWLRIGVSFLIVAAGLAFSRGPGDAAPRVLVQDEARKLVALIGVVALIGLVVGTAACYLPYAVLLQGQPYRALWLLEVIKIPVGLLVIVQCWQRGGQMVRLLAVALAAYLAVWGHGPMELLIVLLPLPVFLFALRKQPDAIARAAAASVLTGLLLLELLVLRGKLGGAGNAPPLERWQGLLAWLDPLVGVALGVWLLVVGYRWFAAPWLFAGLALAVLLGVQITWFALPQSSWYQAAFHTRDQDVDFIRGYIESRWTEARPPTVYWPGRPAKNIWFGLGTDSYYEWPNQTAGVMFSRGLAAESMRRTAVVQRFEVDRMRRKVREPGQGYWNTPPFRPWMERLYLASMAPPEEGGAPAPTADDLRELCRTEAVDVVILPEGYPGLYAASNGRWFIYDAKAVSGKQR